MRAAVFEEVGQPLVITTVDDPRPAPDEVVIEVAHCGICGSDLHVTEFGFVPKGTVLGHEFAGTIVDVGSAVAASWKVGDRVTALPIKTCQKCGHMNPDATGDEGKVSILAPVGTALLGLSIGQSIDWAVPAGKTLKLTLLDVTYQPEAAGDYNR